MSFSTSTTTAPTIGSSSRASWWRLRSARSNYVGIDIGIDSVSVSTFGTDASEKKPARRWLAQSRFDLPVDPALPPQPNWVETVVENLHERLPRVIDGQKAVAFLSLPAPWIHYQTTNESEFVSSRQQCDAMFAGSIFACPAYITSWPVVDVKENRMLAATAETAACRVAEAVMDLGYQVRGILPQGVALLNAAHQLTSLKPSAMLLLECSGGLIAMANETGCGLCRNLPSHTAGSSLGLVELEPWLQEVASELLASSRYVSRMGAQCNDQSPVMICGSLATIEGVDMTLATMLNRPVATWRYAGRHRPQRQRTIQPLLRGDVVHAVSLSLACCSIERSAESWGALS